MNDQIKQRLASIIAEPPLNGCDTREVLRDALAVIEQQEHQIAEMRLNNLTTLEATVIERRQLESQLHERDAACAAMRNAAIEALYRLADGASGQKHDPSWTRPVTLTRQEIQDTCIQAYHWMHKVKEVGAGRDLIERLQKAEAELKAWVETKQNKPSE